MSDVTAIPPLVKTLCNHSSSIALESVEEDATYQYFAFVNNTDGIESKPSRTETVQTIATGQYNSVKMFIDES